MFNVKRNLALILSFLLLSLFYSCDEPDKESILKKTNLVYVNIKMIVTDEYISTLIPEKYHEVLKEVEIEYLAAIEILQENSLEDIKGETALDTIISCGTKILDILDDTVLPEKYKTKIEVSRSLLKVLLANYQMIKN